MSLHLMKGDKLLAICDPDVVSVMDIEKAKTEKHTNDNKQINKLFKLSIPDENGSLAFAGASTNGLLKIWNEVLLDQSNNLVRQDMDPYRLDTLKLLKSQGIQAGGGNNSQTQITDMITLPNGAIVACSVDKSITLYEEKPGNAACGACCSIF